MLTITATNRGRPKGSTSALAKGYGQRDLREMILGALEDAGGRKYLAQRAIDTPGPFLTLLGKVLPTSVSNADGSPIALHLIAAQLVSQQILEMKLEPQSSVQTSVDTPQNLLDAPPPTE